MSKKFGLRLLVVATVLAICAAFSYSPPCYGIAGYNAMPGGQIDPPGYRGMAGQHPDCPIRDSRLP